MKLMFAGYAWGRRALLGCCLTTLGWLAGGLPSARPLAAQDVTPVVHVPNPLTMKAQQAKHYVVLVSLDGFRYDYARQYGAPALDAMAKNGASTPDGMLPSFPSITFPNHLTLVTGLRPEHHGIVGMEFADPARTEAGISDTYVYTDSKANGDGSWYQATPIWVLAEQQGMRSACFFWPGSEAAIEGIRPTFFLHFDDKIEDEKRIAQVDNWLKLPEAERPHLITLYYDNVDHAGHGFGPDTPETRDAVHHLDAMVALLRERLKATGLPVDLIVTADHGMIATDPEPVVLDAFANLAGIRTVGPFLYAPSEAEAERVYEEFRAHPSPKFTAYRRLDVPKSLHYDVSQREGDPVIVANGPYPIYVHAPKRPPNKGSHGFDPHTMPQMKAIFYAEGPDIRAGVKLGSFDNVDVYPFIARLLGLDAPPVDGSLDSLRPALR